MAATRQQLFAFLDRLGIAHMTVEHAPAHTVEDAQAHRGDLPGGHAKNLFLKSKKGELYLIVAEETTPIQLNQLFKRLGAARLSFGNAELMRKVLGIEPGSVTPFALINDRERRQVAVVLDQQLMRLDPLHFHPLHNTATTRIGRDDLLTFIRACGHEPRILDLVEPDDRAAADV